MAAVKTLSIDGKLINARGDQTILQAAEEAGISIPTLCHLEGVSDVGACRLCLVEVGGPPRLLPACTTEVFEEMEVQTDTERLRNYPPDDRRAALRRAQPRLRRLRGQRQLRAPEHGRARGDGPRPVRLPLSPAPRGHQPRAVRHRPQPLRPLHPLRAGLRPARGRPHLGRRVPRGQRPGHHRHAPALGDVAHLHLLRQVHAGLSHRGDLPPGVHGRRDANTTASILAFLVTAREKKQWNV